MTKVPVFDFILAGVLLASALLFAITSWHWPLVGDAALLHYIIFLADHGLTPYRDIPDLNLPGTYAAEALVIHIFGPGDLPWRLFDLSLLGAIGAAGYAICYPRKLAALFAATVFALVHGRDGLIQTGQRDLLMAALLAAAFAFALARPRVWSGFLAGLCLGAACTVKPSAVLFVPVVLIYRGIRNGPRLPAAVGLALAPAASLAYLIRGHALRSFVQLETRLAPLHATLFRLSPARLAAQSVSSVLLPVFAAWLCLFLLQKRWRGSREHERELLLLAGFVCGVLSFCIQGRGYPYHRYPSEVFLLLLAALAFTGPRTNTQKVIAAAGLVFGAFIIVPKSLLQTIHFTWRQDPFRQALTADLQSLGGAALNGKVQCLDMAGGCIAALYHARLTQATGFLYDCYLYPDTRDNAERDRYRAAFERALNRNPPQLLLVTSDECGPADFAYAKLTRWPWLAAHLADGYTLTREYRPDTPQSWGGRPALPYGYRIYSRTGSRTGPATIPQWLPPPSASISAPPTAPSRWPMLPARSPLPASR